MSHLSSTCTMKGIVTISCENSPVSPGSQQPFVLTSSTRTDTQEEFHERVQNIASEMQWRAGTLNGGAYAMGEHIGNCVREYWGDKEIEVHTGSLGVTEKSTRRIIESIEGEERFTPRYIALCEKLTTIPTRYPTIYHLPVEVQCELFKVWEPLKGTPNELTRATGFDPRKRGQPFIEESPMEAAVRHGAMDIVQAMRKLGIPLGINLASWTGKQLDIETHLDLLLLASPGREWNGASSKRDFVRRAIYEDRTDLIHKLADNLYDTERCTNNGLRQSCMNEELWDAVCAQDDKVIEALLAYGAEFRPGWTPLKCAVYHGDVERVKELLDKKVGGAKYYDTEHLKDAMGVAIHQTLGWEAKISKAFWGVFGYDPEDADRPYNEIKTIIEEALAS